MINSKGQNPCLVASWGVVPCVPNGIHLPSTVTGLSLIPFSSDFPYRMDHTATELAGGSLWGTWARKQAMELSV